MKQSWLANSIGTLKWLTLFLTLMAGFVKGAESEESIEGPLSKLNAFPVHDAELAQHRGGFLTSDGIMIALGIADLIRIDGALVAEKSWQINTVSLQQILLGNITPDDRANLILNASGNPLRVQEGLSISSNVDSDTLSVTTLIQNNQDYRVIETFRTINIDVNNLGNTPSKGGNEHVYLRDYYLWSTY